MLNTKEFETLCLFERSTLPVPVPDSCPVDILKALKSRGMLSVNINGDTACISDAGRIALADYRAKHSLERRYAVRYWITTAISILALIVSFAALFK